MVRLKCGREVNPAQEVEIRLVLSVHVMARLRSALAYQFSIAEFC
jgi:hypothetical protein